MVEGTLNSSIVMGTLKSSINVIWGHWPREQDREQDKGQDRGQHRERDRG